MSHLIQCYYGTAANDLHCNYQICAVQNIQAADIQRRHAKQAQHCIFKYGQFQHTAALHVSKQPLHAVGGTELNG